MFLYVFTMAQDWASTEPDDIRVVEGRDEALAFYKILGMRPRVVCKPI